MRIVHLFVSYALVNLCHFFSSSWYQGLAATFAVALPGLLCLPFSVYLFCKNDSTSSILMTLGWFQQGIINVPLIATFVPPTFSNKYMSINKWHIKHFSAAKHFSVIFFDLIYVDCLFCLFRSHSFIFRPRRGHSLSLTLF